MINIIYTFRVKAQLKVANFCSIDMNVSMDFLNRIQNETDSPTLFRQAMSNHLEENLQISLFRFCRYLKPGSKRFQWAQYYKTVLIILSCQGVPDNWNGVQRWIVNESILITMYDVMTSMGCTDENRGKLVHVGNLYIVYHLPHKWIRLIPYFHLLPQMQNIFNYKWVVDPSNYRSWYLSTEKRIKLPDSGKKEAGKFNCIIFPVWPSFLPVLVEVGDVPFISHTEKNPQKRWVLAERAQESFKLNINILETVNRVSKENNYFTDFVRKTTAKP